MPEKRKGWTYEVRSYDAGDFLITRDPLVKGKEPPEEEVKMKNE